MKKWHQKCFSFFKFPIWYETEITILHKQLGKYITLCEVQEIEFLSVWTDSVKPTSALTFSILFSSQFQKMLRVGQFGEGSPCTVPLLPYLLPT